LATVVKIVFMRAWAAQPAISCTSIGEKPWAGAREVLGLEFAGIGRDAEHVLHEQALALRQREHGRIGAEAVERRLVETQLGQVSARGAETTVAPPGVGDEHEGDHPGLPGERRRFRWPEQARFDGHAGLDDLRRGRVRYPVSAARCRHRDALELVQPGSNVLVPGDVEESHGAHSFRLST
jgi:hypothetical protein